MATVMVTAALAYRVGALAWIGIAAGLGGFAILSIDPLLGRRVRVDLHEDGVVVTRRGKRDATVFEDVDTVWYELSIQSATVADFAKIVALRLVDYEGVSHRVPLNLPGIVDTLNTIIKRCSTVHVPAARKAIEAGDTLTFARVGISRNGVSFDGVQTPWSEIRLVRLLPGRVGFFRRFPVIPWKTVRLDRVPHPAVFLSAITACALRVETHDPLARFAG